MIIKMHIKKGDKVKVISGKDKGKTGAVLRVIPKENRVVVDGVGIVKRHTRAKQGQSSRIIEVARSIHASNVKKVSGDSK